MTFIPFNRSLHFVSFNWVFIQFRLPDDAKDGDGFRNDRPNNFYNESTGELQSQQQQQQNISLRTWIYQLIFLHASDERIESVQTWMYVDKENVTTWPRDHVTTWPLRVDVAACNSNLRNGSRYLIIRRPKGCGFYTFPPPTPSKERRRTQLFLRFLFLVSFCSIIFCCFIFLLLLHFFVVASFFCCCFCCCCWSPFPLPSGNSSVVRWPFRLWFSEWRGCITAASSSRAESSERHLHSVTVTNSAAFDPPADWSFSLPLIWMNPAQHCDQLPILTDSGFRNANPPENHFYESRIRHQ